MTRFGNTAGGMSNRRLCNATNWPFLAIRKSKFAPPSNLKHRFGPVQTHPNGFGKVHNNLNHGPNLAFGSGWSPDFELNFGQVHILYHFDQLFGHRSHSVKTRIRVAVSPESA